MNKDNILIDGRPINGTYDVMHHFKPVTTTERSETMKNYFHQNLYFPSYTIP